MTLTRLKSLLNMKPRKMPGPWSQRFENARAAKTKELAAFVAAHRTRKKARAV